VLAAALILVFLAALGSYVFEAGPVLRFQAGRDAASLRAEVASTTGKVKLVISGVGTYTIRSVTIKVTDYSIHPLVPTAFVLGAAESLPVTLLLPSNWTISVTGPYTTGQTITVELQGTWWAFSAAPIPITLTATTRVLWI
jgi:hypothetical protein